MKKLPISKQDFATLISDNYIYVDKTEIIYTLISSGIAYFLSRPRRFGKSLTVTTLKEIFLGNKELFKGLWIYDKIDWKQHPVIHLDFSKIGVKELGAEIAILKALDGIAKEYNVSLTATKPGQKFEELILAMATEQVVILIDEYDKPIIDYIDDIPKAEENREILKNFYSILKGNDKYIKFLFITGVSKFSKVSIFSDLNHLNDITLDDKYSTLCGYTEKELYDNFSDYIQSAQEKLIGFVPDIKIAIKEWYNGYSWNGINLVYNPFSMLNFFSKQRFEDYWFKTGTPTFLLKLIKQRNFNIIDANGMNVKQYIFDKYDIESLDLIALLFQTGYLTIKSYNYKTLNYKLAYPNKEVSLSFETQLLSVMSDKMQSENASLLNNITTAFQNNNIEKFINLLKALFKNITYPLISDKENYYHSIFYLCIKLLGFDIETEILTSDGRIDAVIKTDEFIYVIEFKIGKSDAAMKQLKEKEYHLKYFSEKKNIILLGIGFDTRKKNIGTYLIEVMN